MATVDEALQEIRGILGKGLYPTAVEPVRKVLLKLRGKKATARLYVITSLVWLTGWIAGIAYFVAYTYPKTSIILMVALPLSLFVSEWNLGAASSYWGGLIA